MTPVRKLDILHALDIVIMGALIAALVAHDAGAFDSDTAIGLCLFAIVALRTLGDWQGGIRLWLERARMQREVASWKRATERAVLQANMASYTASMYRLAYEEQVRKSIARPRENLN